MEKLCVQVMETSKTLLGPECRIGLILLKGLCQHVEASSLLQACTQPQELQLGPAHPECYCCYSRSESVTKPSNILPADCRSPRIHIQNYLSCPWSNPVQNEVNLQTSSLPYTFRTLCSIFCHLDETLTEHASTP